jgi:tetratricopeptide (TPR) repeat protein
MKRSVVAVALVALGVAFALWWKDRPPQGPLPAPSEAGESGDRAAAFVGSSACRECHAAQFESWRTSDHALAMQAASAGTVLGDFAGARFEHFGRQSVFEREGERFVVKTDDSAGVTRTFPVRFTFGVRPLQQVLLPLEGGRLQALDIAWDARPAEAGGQRWFQLHPDEPVGPGDALHWTGPYQTWNFMCAECHVTHLDKGWRDASSSYDTTWSELGVACEACHGPGSGHVAWARNVARSSEDGELGLAVRLRDPVAAAWILEPGAVTAHRSPPRSSPQPLETCALCHARRSVVWSELVPGEPLLQTHRPAFLEAELYDDLGQARAEVYEYGSFLQSRMHTQGVTCTDCHEPHGLGLLAQGNALCTRCHLAEHFDAPSHTGHSPASAGAQCVNCHMPAKLDMVIDARRDHSLRIPRPDLTVALGAEAAPNACNLCHADRSPEWALERATASWGAKRFAEPHYGTVLHAARRELPGAGAKLLALAGDASAAPIVRATALSHLARYPSAELDALLERTSLEAEPLVRLATVQAAEALSPGRRSELLAPLLRDPVRTVRIDAARALADAGGRLPGGAAAELERGLEEFRASQRANADRAEAHVELGSLALALGAVQEAEREFRVAMRLSPHLAAGHVDCADALRLQGRDSEGEALLRRALELEPDQPDLRHALGLTLVRLQRRKEGLAELELASALRADDAHFAAVCAVALESAGRDGEAAEHLERALELRPADPELLLTLAELEERKGKTPEALAHARLLAERLPGDPQAAERVRRLAAQR